MMKNVFACGFAAALAATPALAGESSLLRKGEWQGAIETFLPAPSSAVPWLNIDSRTKLPKGDFPVGRHAGAIPPLAPADQPPTQMSARDPARRL